VKHEDEPLSVTARGAWRWLLYDGAEAAFATTVMAGFFPIFLVHAWGRGVSPATDLANLALVTGGASVVVAALAPFTGAMADARATRGRFLTLCVLLGVAATAALAFLPAGALTGALVLYGLAAVGYSGANVFYNALLPHAVAVGTFARVSTYGYATGYLAGGALFAAEIAVATHPTVLGLASAQAVRAFVLATVALWWAVLALPLLLRSPEIRPGSPSSGPLAREGWARLRRTFREVRRHRTLFLFLIAYWCYIDGVNTIIRLAVSYGLALGFPSSSLVEALLLTQAVAFPSAVLYARLGERWGLRRGILLAIGVYALVTLAATWMRTVGEFFALAAVVGLVQGGIQGLSRAYYGRLVPRGRSAEFFGFYGVVGKFSAVLGPVLVAVTELATGSARGAIATVVLLFVAGGGLLLRLPAEAEHAPTPAD
jgi:UMF1 family MFS transporter